MAVVLPALTKPSGAALSRQAAHWEGAVLGAFLLVVWLAPLPLGSNRTWALALLACAVLPLWLLACLGFALGGSSLWARLGQARPVAAVWCALGLLPLVQLALPGGTQDAFQTRQLALCALVYGAAFTAVVALANTPQRLHKALLVLLTAGIVQAALAIVLWSTQASYFFMHQPVRHGERAIGSFMNFNHLALFLYVCMFMGLGLIVYSLLRQPHKPALQRRQRLWQQRLAAVLGFLLSPRMLLRLMLVIMVIALVLTRSRMGNTAFFTAVLLAGGLVWWRFTRWRQTALWLVASLVVVDVLVVGQWVGLDKVVDRLQGTKVQTVQGGPQESLEARTEPGRYTLALVQSHPLLGTGAGTYYTAFPPYKAPHMWLYFDHAHNDYAQIAADQGLLGLGLMALLVLASAVRALRLLGPQQRSISRAMGLVGAMTIWAVLLHSLVDFNLQIPANALLVSVVLALLWAAPMATTKKA